MSIHDELSRRKFIQTSAAAIAGAAALNASESRAEAASQPGLDGQDAQGRKRAVQPVVIASANGAKEVNQRSCLSIAMEELLKGTDPLDAVIAGVNLVEDDPTDNSVGLGGHPNEDGVVELDASVMHGPTHKAGAVASLRNIRNPSKVARLVMQRTDHVLIVGEGALRFARAHGFKEEDLLTEESRRQWLKWKESHSDEDDWLSPEQAAGKKTAALRQWSQTYGTINCCAVNANGDIAGVTTTSGLSNKIAGRVGDSPIIGAGLYVDNDVGAAGSTGRGEANLQNCSSFAVVELMRNGKSPEAACLEAMKRIADRCEARLRDAKGRPKFDLKLYALSKSGRYGAASMWKSGQYSVHDGKSVRILDCAYLFEKDAKGLDG